MFLIGLESRNWKSSSPDDAGCGGAGEKPSLRKIPRVKFVTSIGIIPSSSLYAFHVKAASGSTAWSGDRTEP